MLPLTYFIYPRRIACEIHLLKHSSLVGKLCWAARKTIYGDSVLVWTRHRLELKQDSGVVQGTHPFWLCLAFQLLDCGMETEETMQLQTATENYTAFSVFCCLLATNLHDNLFEFVLYCIYDNLINILFSCVLQYLSYTRWRKYCSFGFLKRKIF